MHPDHDPAHPIGKRVNPDRVRAFVATPIAGRSSFRPSGRPSGGSGAGRGVALYVAAMFGAHLSYAPLLTLLLPRRIVAVALDHAAAVTSLVVLAGAITASLGHILAGRISDGWRRRHGNRRAPIALGLVLTMLALAWLGLARQVAGLALGLVAFQAALNLMFAPLGALLVDHFDDGAKARVAALVNLAMPLAGLGTGAAALVFPHDGPAPFLAIAALVGLSVVPLLVIWPFAPAIVPADPARRTPAPARDSMTGRHGGMRAGRRGADLAQIGLARLLVQCGAVFTMSYFYLFLVRDPLRAGVMPGHSVDVLYGRLVMVTTLLVLLVTVPVGQWSDRQQRRRAPMVACALVAGLALCAVQAGSGWLLLGGYAVFQAGLIAYLSLDAATVAQILRDHPRPGEMLGYMNLANTLPSVCVPLIVLAASGAGAEPGGGAAAALHPALHVGLWAPGFAAAAACCMLAAALVAQVRTVA
jgi:MFS family permease